MSMNHPPDASPVERLQDVPTILRALRQAAGQAMRRHREAGVPIAIWQDNAVVRIAPEDIPEIDTLPEGDRE